jgi:hypothetical protein
MYGAPGCWLVLVRSALLLCSVERHMTSNTVAAGRRHSAMLAWLAAERLLYTIVFLSALLRLYCTAAACHW